jgi:hypothetical protein
MTSRQQDTDKTSISPALLFARIGRIVFVCIVLVVGAWQLRSTTPESLDSPAQRTPAGTSPAAAALQKLAIKGRAPKTGYERELFSSGWGMIAGCDVRNYILTRDLVNVTYVGTSCKVASGTLHDPYTGSTLQFIRGTDTSDDIQIDHVVALSDAWQKGAQALSAAERYALANDPLELLAVDGKVNQAKADSDAASWLPPNKEYRCNYVARQIAVKLKYKLWVTEAEYSAMAKVLTNCPEQPLP